MSIDINTAKKTFEAHFGFPPELGARAPGRVNIIGEHTDYNQGFVLPMAIEHETVLLGRARPDRVVKAFAANLDCTAQADLDHRVRDAQEPWIDYVVGVADELAKLGRALSGVDLMIVGDVPIGCGLSSSASLEMAALVLFETLGGFRLEGPDAARLGRRVENDFLGLSTGIMDQFISRMGQSGHALFLDCRTYAYELVRVAFPNAVFVIANTCVARGLTSSKYNERVGECAEAVRRMGAKLGKTGTHLRDYGYSELEACGDVLPDRVFRRARHVITEDERTRAARVAMNRGELEALGTLMDASDASLRDDYEVTCPALDAMTEVARHSPGCYGSRMTGAGFGGCTISLVEASRVDEFAAYLLAGYKERTGTDGEVFFSTPAQGACALDL